MINESIQIRGNSHSTITPLEDRLVLPYSVRSEVGLRASSQSRENKELSVTNWKLQIDQYSGIFFKTFP